MEEPLPSPPVDATMLRHVIRLVTEATDCRGCFVYLLQDHELGWRGAGGRDSRTR